MLSSLTESSSFSSSPASTRQRQQRLVEARLGVASGLFTAMRVKHEATAMHCLRVALGCSAWSLLRDMTSEQRDALEIAALLHDVGKIGIPDVILLKPGKLGVEEAAKMEQHKLLGQQIIAACCTSGDVLEILHYSTAWFDGSHEREDVLEGEDLPLGARMMAIVDAYDSMMTDHVYRRALPRERAIAELYDGGGTQFDPELVAEFCSLTESDHMRLDESVGARWLHELKPSHVIWSQGPQLATSHTLDDLAVYHDRLFQAMHDAVIFIDRFGRIESWNNAAERITGVSATAVVGQQWMPELIELWDDDEEEVPDDECPVSLVIKSGVQAFERGSMADRNGQRRGINLQMIPVRDPDGFSRGVIVVIRDASNQINLEERVQTLHEKATQDPLTKVANRAEFDQSHAEFIDRHSDSGAPCSLVICDIDHFKKVNDNFGHQAGDEALVAFAEVLQSHTRAGDLVARYGGEEFVLLCADCDSADAARRAEEIRSRLSQIPQPMLNNMCITASFGVTSLQAGDTPSTMLARADRALFQAKQGGRNRVVQLGTGVQQEDELDGKERAGWFGSLLDVGTSVTTERAMHTPVPMNLAVDKLRGFVSDHKAGIIDIEEGRISLSIDSRHLESRREGDRPVAFVVDIRLQEHRSKSGTEVHVRIRPARRRDRRLRDVELRATQFLHSLRAYLMANDIELTKEVRQRGLFPD